jgi:predicted N-acetyltransferase YhbS
MSVRPVVESDIPQVADLYWRYIRRRKGPAPPAVLSALRELYFANPFSDSANPSLVYEGTDGRVVGFLGGTVRRMSVCGQPLKVVYYGNLAVDPEFRSGRAAPDLLKALMATDHDLSMGDSANDISRKVLGQLGFRTITALSIHWSRPLRPSHYAVYALSRATGPALSASLKLAKPFCTLADSVATRFSVNPFRPTKSPLLGAELDPEVLLRCLSEFREGRSLCPEYDLDSLKWLLSFMERHPTRGDVRKVVVRNDRQKIVGWYVYYLKPGALAEVVQIGSERKVMKDVLDHLFYDAWEQGAIALHGVVDLRRIADFSDKGCLFTCRGGWTVAYSRKPELLDLLDRGDAFLSRLDGEWALDPGD